MSLTPERYKNTPLFAKMPLRAPKCKKLYKKMIEREGNLKFDKMHIL